MNEFLYSISNVSILQVIFCTILLISAIMVNISENPVESVLFLVLTFITSGILLMTFLSEFFGIIVIIIYVGAIAVLFLFVIMMLNIKSSTFEFSISPLFQSKISKFCLFSSVLYFISIYFTSKTTTIFSKVSFNKSPFLLDSIDNIQSLGQVLYNYYLECFLIAGLLLLVALIGSIVLTLNYNNIKKGQQLPDRQLSRTDRFLSFFY